MTLSELIDLYKKGELSDSEECYTFTILRDSESLQWISYNGLGTYIRMAEELRRKHMERLFGLKDE